MRILIENYRGFDIEFDSGIEKFICIASDESAKESSSFSAVKKFIDDYKKSNQDFKPFWVEAIPEAYGKGTFKIIGIRKDGRFITEDKTGKKEQLSDYDLNNYMLKIPDNESLLKELTEIDLEFEKIRREKNIRSKEIISKLKVVTLKEYKKQIAL